MNLAWFRLYAEAVDDDKLRLLAFEDRWHFVALLCCKAQGILDSHGDLVRRKVCVKLGLDMRELDEVARRLSEVELIDQHTLEPLAWSRRQFVSDRDSTAAERQRRRRQKLKESTENECVTDASRVTSRNSHGRVTRPETETETETEKEKPAYAGKKKPPVNPACPDDVNPDTYRDFLAVRKAKRAPLTATALAGLRREAAKAGMSLQDAMAMCCERGWVSLRSAWPEVQRAVSASPRGGQVGNAAEGDW